MSDSLLTYRDVPPFVSDLGIEIVERSVERIVTRLPDSPRFHNRKGDVHGGAAATLIDTTLGFASTEGDPEGTASSTLMLTISYLAPARGELRCTSTWQRRGRSIRFLEAAVTDETGTLVATAQATFKVFIPRTSGMGSRDGG